MQGSFDLVLCTLGATTRPTWRRALTLLGMKRCLWIREPGVGNGDELAELAVVVEREARSC